MQQTARIKSAPSNPRPSRSRNLGRASSLSALRRRAHFVRLQPCIPSTLVGAILAGLAGLFVLVLPLGEGLTELSYDLPFLFRRDIKPEEEVIVYMDWDSHVRLGQEQ